MPSNCQAAKLFRDDTRRPRVKYSSILIVAIGRNGHFVPLEMTYLAANLYLVHWGNEHSSMEKIWAKEALFPLLVIIASCLAPLAP